MKNYPLSIQIWIVFALITIATTIILFLAVPITLRGFFTNEIYSNIESAQNLLLNRFSIEDFWNEDIIDGKSRLEDIRTVNHFLIYGNNQIMLDSPISFDFIDQVKEDIISQKSESQRYDGILNSEKIFYVITKGKSFGQEAYLVSYMGDSYRQDLVGTLFKRLFLVMGIIFLLSWIPAILLSRYLSKPLVNLESRVERLAESDWEEAISLDRKDEIGRLGDSVEELRSQLIRQDKAEQVFLQNISHELKTPVMVIRSFAAAIKDGIFPKGDLDSSIGVIDGEAERLESKIRNLLYYSKLEYMEDHRTIEDDFSLDGLINDVVNRLSWNQEDIDWSIDLKSLSIRGDKDQWRVVIENIIDNQIRYAKDRISVNLYTRDNRDILEIWNNGPPIEPAILDNLFKEYNKGEKGEFGLGLAIVGRILKLNDSSIEAINEDSGVRFIIEI